MRTKSKEGVRMKKHANNMMVLVMIGILCFCGYLKFANSSLETFGLSTTSKVVVIDAGHGGHDPGKAGPNESKEDEINLQIALKLKDYLEHAGTTVIMTRMDDEYLQGPAGNTHKRKDMSYRKHVLTQSDADILVSIHQNAFSDQRVRGAQVFYHEQSEKGKLLATAIQQGIKEHADPANNRPIKSSDHYYLLNESAMPGVIIECGFLTNLEEERLLMSDEYQEKIAWSIYMGIIKYFEEIK